MGKPRAQTDTPEFFKLTAQTVVPTLAKVYHAILQGGDYIPSGFQAHIKLIAKKGKDPTEPSSYRPISLLNIDSKILSKIIANRLARIVPTLIHPAQAGFIQGHSASSNIRKVLTVLEHAKTNTSDDIAIISLDAEKAFDNVGFPWLSLVLQHFGFSGPFLHLISSMYAAPMANVVAAGLISKPIKLHKGTRQGCPLSPLLFNLAIEPLSRHLV